MGADDERGTLNYITPDMLVRAARLVRRGAVFSLAIPFNAKGPQTTQWDALGHCLLDGIRSSRSTRCSS